MGAIFLKEINTFFSSLIGYIVIGVFLTVMGLMMWLFEDTSILNYGYATLDQLFSFAPLIFMFLIPAVTMRSFAEERQSGTIELLSTKPLSDLQITLGKYFACLALVIFALLPTLIYVYTVYQLGQPAGNIDIGEVAGSYLGLVLLSAVFVAIGIFASTLTNNQIVSFVLAVFLCFIFYWGFDFFAKLPIFFGKVDDLVEMIGIDYHYREISAGKVDTRQIIYFISVICVFTAMTLTALKKHRL